MPNNKQTTLANEHVEWFLAMLKPLLIEHFKHGFKHGVEWTKSNQYEFDEDSGTYKRRTEVYP